MRLSELGAGALREIRAHKARSALSSVSIAIGVAAVLYTLSQSGGMTRRYREIVDLTGPGRLEIQARRGYVSKGLSRGLTWEDAEAIRRLWPELYMVFPEAARNGTRIALADFRNRNFRVFATNEEWPKRDWVYSLRGRFLNAADVRSAARVCVLIESGGWVRRPYWARYFSEKAMDKVLKQRDLLGTRVRLEDHLFTVVGILKEPPRDKDPRWRHTSHGESGTAVVPITALRSAFEGAGRRGAALESIQVDTGDAATVGEYQRRIEALLRHRHRGEPDFEVRDYRELLAGYLQRMRGRMAAVLAIGVVAILAGGIGIMNVTLATTFARVREIGIRRALGATRADIVRQFVAEAAALGFLGGLAGTPLGFAAVRCLSPDLDRMAPLGPGEIAAGLLIAAGTGLVFAIVPAWQASRFDPLEALRYE